MRLKLFKKYFFTNAVIILFSLTFMMMILAFVLNSYIAKSKQQTLDKARNEVIDYISSSNINIKRDTDELYGILKTIAAVSDVNVFIGDNSGEVFLCGCEEWQQEKNCFHTASKIETKEVKGYLDAVSDLHVGTLGIYETPHYLTLDSIIDNEGKKQGIVFVTASVSEVGSLLSTVTQIYLLSAALPLIIMFFAIYAMTYRLTKPLKQMSEASRAMAKGDFSKRIPVTSDDEIGELAASFNMMTNSLAQLEGMRKSFVANVSHELKTPMTTIGGFIDGILDGTIEAEKQDYYLNIVSQEVKRLSRLVQSMLSMAKLESGELVLKYELFDLRELLLTVVISQEQRIEAKRLEIIGLDELQGVSVKADRDLIYQAVYNLIDNAIKFAEEGGKIKFSLKNENKKTILTVTNTGSGIPEKDLPFIFERFYKVDKSRSAAKNSTGLGLYIVKTIVTAHGGSVAVSSKENELTSFKIIFP